jgi:Protein of unknown function (DUF3383).
MAIDIRYIVNVYPRTLPPGAQGLEMHGLLLSRSPYIPLSPEYGNMLQFPSAADVGEYFGTSSPEYEFANHYFPGFDTAERRPRLLLVAAYPDQPRPAWVRGDVITDPLSVFKSVQSGTFTASFSGTDVEITPINLSTITSYSEAALILQNAIQAAAPENNSEIGNATIEYNSDFSAFVLTSGSDGEDGETITDIAGTIAELMNLTVEKSPVVSNGSSGKAATDIMESVKATTQNWASFTTSFLADSETKVALAKWQTLYPNSFLYVAWDTDKKLTIANNTDNDAVLLRNLNVDVAFVYGESIYAAFFMGSIASVNYQGRNSVVTFAHRFQTGLPYNVNDTVTARALEDKRVNFYGNYALRNDKFQFAFPGMTLGEYKWIDHFVNSIWFFSALETGAAFGLRYCNRVPYNEPGKALVRSFYQDAINSAVRNGTIDKGLGLSEMQKTQIIQEAGFDITGLLVRNGYYLLVEIPGPEVRVNRESTLNKLWYTYAGSVHRLDLSATSIT